jgi:putative resolvase
MKLSEYAKRIGISYKTAYRMWAAGQLDAYQLLTGTIIVRESAPIQEHSGMAIYARVSTAEQRADLERQVERLRWYAASHGYQVRREMREIASGVNDMPPKLAALLSDPSIEAILVEHRDHLTRFGFNYIRLLLEQQHRRIVVINTTETGNDLVDDFVAVITSMAARRHGRRHARNRAERIKQCLEAGYGDDSAGL